VSPEHLVLLAIIQGVTEFLPVSSSGHLNLVHLLTDMPDQGPVMDVAVHVGSLLAVFVYFWRDMLYLLGGARDVVTGRWSTHAARLLALLALASVPVVIAGGLMLASGLIHAVRSLEVIAWTTVVFGLVLWACDRLGRLHKTVQGSRLSDALVIGLAQCLALIPGVSRSGICMSAARAIGFERTEAARYAMLLAIPAIVASGAGTLLDVAWTGDGDVLREAVIAGALSAVAAFLSIWFMIALLRRVSMLPFVIYRLALGVVLMWFVYA
jgi:undecaprenyl-diphosphatase